jgi:hypothetical protein
VTGRHKTRGRTGSNEKETEVTTELFIGQKKFVVG